MVDGPTPGHLGPGVTYDRLARAETITPADSLLRDWLLWWWESDSTPAKIANGLHVRTALHLQQLYPDIDIAQILATDLDDFADVGIGDPPDPVSDRL